MTVLTGLHEGLAAPGVGGGRGHKRFSLRVAARRKGQQTLRLLGSWERGQREDRTKDMWSAPMYVKASRGELWLSTHCGQPLEGRDGTEEKTVLSLETHSMQKVLINCVELTRPGTTHTKAWTTSGATDSPVQSSCGTGSSGAVPRWLCRAGGPGTGSALGEDAGCHSSRSYSFPCI